MDTRPLVTPVAGHPLHAVVNSPISPGPQEERGSEFGPADDQTEAQRYWTSVQRKSSKHKQRHACV